MIQGRRPFCSTHLQEVVGSTPVFMMAELPLVQPQVTAADVLHTGNFPKLHHEVGEKVWLLFLLEITSQTSGSGATERPRNYTHTQKKYNLQKLTIAVIFSLTKFTLYTNQKTPLYFIIFTKCAATLWPLLCTAEDVVEKRQQFLNIY